MGICNVCGGPPWHMPMNGDSLGEQSYRDCADYLREQLAEARRLVEPMLEAAKKAGNEWEFDEDEFGRCGSTVIGLVTPRHDGSGWVCNPEDEYDARHIAATNPAAIIALARALGCEVGE